MNKNRKKLPTVVVCVVLAAMLLFSGVYAAVDAGWFRRESEGEAPVSSGQETPPSPSSSAQEDLPPMYQFVDTAAGDFLPKPDIFEDEEGHSASTSRFRVTVNRVYVAKDTQGLPYPYYLSEQCGEKVDENGTLISGHSYFFMDITLENRTNLVVDFDISWTKPYFYVGDTRLMSASSSGEVALQSINNDVPIKSRYQYTMQPEETVEYTIAYIFPDDELAEATDVFTVLTAGNPAVISKLIDIEKDKSLYAWNPDAPFINLTPLWEASK